VGGADTALELWATLVAASAAASTTGACGAAACAVAATAAANGIAELGTELTRVSEKSACLSVLSQQTNLLLEGSLGEPQTSPHPPRATSNRRRETIKAFLASPPRAQPYPDREASLLLPLLTSPLLMQPQHVGDPKNLMRWGLPPESFDLSMEPPAVKWNTLQDPPGQT